MVGRRVRSTAVLLQPRSFRAGARRNVHRLLRCPRRQWKERERNDSLRRRPREVRGEEGYWSASEAAIRAGDRTTISGSLRSSARDEFPDYIETHLGPPDLFLLAEPAGSGF